MQNIWKHIGEICKKVFYIGSLIQIVAGLLWLCVNIKELAWYADGSVYQQAVSSWDFSNCKGILYPFIVSMSMGMAKILPIPYYCLISAFQLVVALAAIYWLLRTISTWTKGKLWFATAAVVMTAPVLQTQTALQPGGLAASCLIAGLTLALLYERERKLMSLIGSGVFWLLACLLRMEYFWFGLIPIVLWGVWKALRIVGKARAKGGNAACDNSMSGTSRRRRLHFAVAVLIVVLVGTGGYSMQKHVLYGEKALSIKQTLTLRLVWGNIANLMLDWTDDLQEVIGLDNALIMTTSPEKVKELLFVNFGQLSAAQENAYLKEFARMALAAKGKKLLLEIGNDGVGYMVPAAIMERQLDGRGYMSMTSLNYQAFKEGNAGLGKFCMRYYFWWFWMALLLAVVRQLCVHLGKDKKELMNREQRSIFLCGAVLVLGLSVYYTCTEPGLYDYKLAICSFLFWSMGSMFAVLGKGEIDK